ncbi:unnamed protein product [Mytilus edulis]|uniref:CCHC-type domain-containing protein n=1 Tax=Mytilus edulis TaxID=6550 RepID=A0A8S3SC15_MYTED|nr:unnamed protein product [Mytilus edulis]
MDTQRTRNFGRNWRYQMSDNGATFQTRNSTQHMDNCLCKFCGKTVNNQFHFRQCIAKTSFCYKCRNFGHFARMCNFHRQPDVKVVKVKSKSKLRRDAERMRIFKENKAMSMFPCAELNTIELMDFFPSLEYNNKFIDNSNSHFTRLYLVLGRTGNASFGYLVLPVKLIPASKQKNGYAENQKFWPKLEYQMSDNGTTFQTRNSTQHMDNCLCKFCGKTVNNQFHFRQCIAKTSFCYKCRNFGHFARMCNFHRQPDVKVVKVKSKSKLRRDAERMRIFKENKAMSMFPCAELNTIELMDFFPSLEYNKEFIDNVRLRHDRVNSERVKFKIKSVHYEKKFKDINQKHSSVVSNLEKLKNKTQMTKKKWKNYRNAIRILKKLILGYTIKDVKPSTSNINYSATKERMLNRITTLEDELDNIRKNTREDNYSNQNYRYRGRYNHRRNFRNNFS